MSESLTERVARVLAQALNEVEAIVAEEQQATEKESETQDNQSAAVRHVEYLTVAQLAERLHVGKSTVYGWVERDDIPFRMAGDLLRFNPVEVDAWMIEKAQRKRERKAGRKSLVNPPIRMVK